MFNLINHNTMAKYIYRELETRDGEREYTHKAVHKFEDDDANVEEFLADYLKDFWGEEADVDSYGDHWFFGEIITSISNWTFITKTEYDTLRKFI